MSNSSKSEYESDVLNAQYAALLERVCLYLHSVQSARGRRRQTRPFYSKSTPAFCVRTRNAPAHPRLSLNDGEIGRDSRQQAKRARSVGGRD